MADRAFSIQDFTPPGTSPSSIKEKKYHISSQDDVSGSSNKAQIRVKLYPSVLRPAGMELLAAYLPAAIWNVQDGMTLNIVQDNGEVINFNVWQYATDTQDDSGGNWSLADLADMILFSLQQSQSGLVVAQDLDINFRPERNVITISSPVGFDIKQTAFSDQIGWTQGADNDGVFWAESPEPLDLNQNVHALFIQFANLGWANTLGSSNNRNMGFAKVSLDAEGSFSYSTWHHLSRYTVSAHSGASSIDELEINLLDEDGNIVDFLVDWHLTVRFFYYAQ